MTGCVVITGASGKIGARLTRHFIETGETVVAIASRKDGLDRLGGELSSDARSRLRPLVLNLTLTDAAARLSAFLDRSGLKPSGLVNSARSLDLLGTEPDGSVSRDKFSSELLLDVIVPYELTLALANAAGAALTAVVNVASMYGVVAPNPALYEGRLAQSPISYGVAKAALIHLTRELAVRLAPRVRVNAVSYGGVAGRVDAAFEARYAALCPAGRMLTEDEVAGPVAFALSPASAGMTGHNLIADGGWSVW